MSRRKTILLVKKGGAIASARKRALEKYGCMVITAASGEKAVEKICSVAGIDLFLADVNPGNGMDGLKAAQFSGGKQTGGGASRLFQKGTGGDDPPSHPAEGGYNSRRYNGLSCQRWGKNAGSGDLQGHHGPTAVLQIAY